jgi:ABC-type transport system substrate-binding protein
LRQAGLPNDVAYNAHLGVGWGPYWLDPLGSKFGENAKFFKRNVPEAKKLISAAGYPNGLESNFYSLQQVVPAYGTNWANQMQVLLDFCAEGGLKFKLNLEDYSTVYIPKYHFSKGNFDGMSASPGGARSDPVQTLQIFYHSGGSATRTPAGADDKLDGLISKMAQELDHDKRVAIGHDVQKYMAGSMIGVPYSYQATGFDLVWPFVGNAGTYRAWTVGSGPTETLPFTWYDSSKRST